MGQINYGQVGRNRCSEGLARTRPGWADPVVTYPWKADCLVSSRLLGDWCTGGRDEGPASSAPIIRPYQGLEGRHSNIIQRVHNSKCASCVEGTGKSTSKASSADDLEPGNVTQHPERLRLPHTARSGSQQRMLARGVEGNV